MNFVSRTICPGTISCPCGKVALTPVIAIECVECCGLQDTVDDVALTFRERNLTVGCWDAWSNMFSLRQRGPSFPESDRFDAESGRLWLVCLTWRRKNCRKRDVAKSVLHSVGCLAYLFLLPFWFKDFRLYVQHFCFWSCLTFLGLLCSACIDNQRHIRVLYFCGQVLVRFGERSVCGTAAQ